MSAMKLAAAVAPLMLVLLMASSSQSNADKPFDFYYLSLMWPGAYCAQTKAGCCVPKSGLPASDFFISGLWTFNSTTGKAVTKCRDSSFYIAELNELRPALDQYWSNIKCPSTDGVSLWKNAWKTYGVCAEDSEEDYFKTALKLREKVDLLNVFYSNGIAPSKTSNGISNRLTLHKLSYIEDSIQAALGAKPVIQCSMTPEQIFQVYQVLLCVDQDGENIIECPVKPQFTCSQYVMFNPFDTSFLKPIATSEGAGIKMPGQA